MNVADLFVKYIKQMHVKYIFGIPGAALEPMYKAVDRSNKKVSKKNRLEIILTKHEQGAAFMADGYARVNRSLGVCWGTTGPGSTNLITGIASSYADSIPILVLTAQVPMASFGKGAVQESTPYGVDMVDLFRSFTKFSAMVIHPQKAGDMFRQALRFAMSGRKGPVHLNIPVDLMEAKVQDESLPILRIKTQSRNFDRDSIENAASLLLGSKKPAILIGNGTLHAEAAEDIMNLTDVIPIPIATTPKAKGAFPEDHPLSLGVFGLAGCPWASNYLLNLNKKEPKVDVLLTVATSFNEWGTNAWDDRLSPEKALIQVDVDPYEFGKNYPFEVELAGDAKAIIQELIVELQNQLSRLPQKRQRAFQQRNQKRKEALKSYKKKKPKYLQKKEMNSRALPLKPQRLMKDLKESLPEDAIIFSDIGNNLLWALHYFSISKPYTFFAGLGFASMGYAAAAPIGAKLAAPDKPIVAILGDGGFLMNGMEVATAANYNQQVIWVVQNNCELGMVSHGRKMMKIPYNTGAEFKRVDFVKIAEGLGVRGIKITEPGAINKKMMDNIIANGKPTVLDVRIDRNETPPLTSRVNALKELYF